MRPCTLACLVANECSTLDHRNRVWLLVWTVLWYELVCPAVFGLAHDRRCEHPGMVLMRLPPYSIVQGREMFFHLSSLCAAIDNDLEVSNDKIQAYNNFLI